VEDRGVVALERRRQEREHVGIRRREVDVTTPDPAGGRVREVVDHGRRLRIVDDDVVVVVLEEVRVQRVVAVEELLLLLREPVRVALERVVDRLGDREELVVALDDSPLDVEADVPHQGNECEVDLGYTAAERRRREVDDSLALERFREPANLVHDPPRRKGRVLR
jgi:hypothetical protein